MQRAIRDEQERQGEIGKKFNDQIERSRCGGDACTIGKVDDDDNNGFDDGMTTMAMARILTTPTTPTAPQPPPTT